jgi:uncharacterized protein
MRKTLIIALFISSGFTTIAQAASFDCAKASATVEKLICADEKLSVLDDQLAAAYKTASETATDKTTLKTQQKNWLKKKRNICKEAECLTKTYQARIDALTPSAVAKVQSNNASSSAASVTAKKPLTFTLTKGEGYPLCKQYVEMLNATQYPNKGALACERKHLPNYPLFKSPQWTEITDKQQMEIIITERIKISLATSTWKKEQITAEVNEFIKYLHNNTLKTYFFKDDFDKDGIVDTAYKFEHLYPVADESKNCKYQTLNYVDDGKTTLENVTPIINYDSLRYEGFHASGWDQLFYYGGTIFNSSWSGPGVEIWQLGNHTICEFSIN